LRDKAFNALQTICRLSIDNELTGSIKKVPQRVHLISWSGFSNLGRRSMGRPETHYANAGDISIAYQLVGGGPFDLLYAQGWLSNIEYAWESPHYAEFLTKLGRFSRLIFFDKRGTGLSDRDVGFPTLEQRTEDITAVLDAVGSQKAAFFGVSEGGNMSALFAATYPERTTALVLYGSSARGSRAPDYPYGFAPESIDQIIASMRQNWGKPFDLHEAAPSMADDEAAKNWWGAYLRNSASPKTAEMITRLNAELDTREILPTINCPTLVINRDDDVWHSPDEARFLADLIPNSTLKIVPGVDHLPWYGDQDNLIGEIQDFLTGQRDTAFTDRVLLTVLMTDIVGSTDKAAVIGDRNWRSLLDQHDAIVRRRVGAYGGQTINTTGDGFITAFTGPTRAIQCAEEILADVSRLDMKIRIGVHTGECERRGSDIGGLAVHIAARILDHASPGQILVSGTVRDLTVGSGLEMMPVGTQSLKGVPGEWPLYAAAA
jgi:pimeloyl-ACP methyl ester carboxylesterase/class 3 adenylate cyclase